MLEVLDEKLRALVYIYSDLLCKFLDKLDSKFSHPDQESERLGHSAFNRKYVR